MSKRTERFELIIGKEATKNLQNKTVAIFGVGGVGGYVLESLVRSGVGHIVIIDNDVVSESNINRQIIATTKTIGLAKVDVAEERAKEINPDVEIIKYKTFYLPENRNQFDFGKYDYVVDAIDTVTAKIDIILQCKLLNVPIISAMGAGNKMNPTMLEVSDISKTEMDPLCKVMRRELRNRGINHLKVVYSKEKALEPLEHIETNGKRSTPGSSAFVPATAGLIIASEVIKDLIQFDPNNRKL